MKHKQVKRTTKRLCGVTDGEMSNRITMITCPECIKILNEKKPGKGLKTKKEAVKPTSGSRFFKERDPMLDMKQFIYTD